MNINILRAKFSSLLALTAVTALILFPSIAYASGTGNMYFTQITPTIAVGQTLTVQVRVNTNGSSVNAVESDFTYPTSQLSFASIDTSASSFDIDATATGGSGSVSIARGSSSGATGISGDLDVANITFNVLAAGAANLTFQNSSVALDSTTNTDDLSTLTNGSFTPAYYSVYRFYIKQTYEHFWTTDLNERNSMLNAGYQYEGTAWYSSTDTSKTPVYRLYAPSIKQHLLTIDANEKNVLSASGGWTYEGIAWYQP